MLSKRSPRLIITIAAIILVLSMLFSAYFLAERLYPNAFLKLRREFLYLGTSIELAEFRGEVQKLTLEELLSDERTTLDNSLLLVSSEHPISESISFADVKEYNQTDVMFDKSAHEAFAALSSHVSEKHGEKLFITSAYRTGEEQQELFDKHGSDTAQRPGESEHQTGLALDIAVKGYGGSSFLKTDVGKYVNLSAWQYGFIIRYPDGKEAVTKISYEPWHIRYVGMPHAEFIEKNQITLEEYLDCLSFNTLYTLETDDNYCIIRVSNTNAINAPSSYSNLTVSPDNLGGYILTFKLS